MALFLGTVVAMVTILSPTRRGMVLMSATEYELHRATEY